MVDIFKDFASIKCDKININLFDGVVDRSNYNILIADKNDRIIYANRKCAEKYLKTTSIDAIQKEALSIKEINTYLQEKMSYSKKSFNKDTKTIKLFNAKRFIGYLFIEKSEEEHPINLTANSIKEVFSKDYYHGLYLADGKANTIKTNSSYEKISLLPESEVRWRNLKELEEKGYFSRSVTLLVLKKFNFEGIAQEISIKQKIITGKNALVTGIPLLSTDGNIKYVITVVKEIIPMEDIKTKLESSPHQKIWTGFGNKERKMEYLFEFDGNFLVAKDKKTINTIKKAEKASFGMSSILLKGETGVGKDLLAKYIHYFKSLNTKKNLPFIEVSCANLPKELIEIELFGYESGAFSGAKKGGKRGLVELANEGILFLNEIGELPIDTQAKLLTVLDSGSIRKVGGTKETKIKFQLISATNKNIEKMVEENKFRRDLYYRISSIVIDIPPLRERREDILPLIFFYIIKHRNKLYKNITLPSFVLDVFMKYEWPGNVRELINTLVNIYTVADGNIITLDDLPDYLTKKKPKKQKNPSPYNDIPSPLKEMVRQYELNLIQSTIKEIGKISEAAKLLRVDPSTIRRKLRKR